MKEQEHIMGMTTNVRKSTCTGTQRSTYAMNIGKEYHSRRPKVGIEQATTQRWGPKYQAQAEDSSVWRYSMGAGKQEEKYTNDAEEYEVREPRHENDDLEQESRRKGHRGTDRQCGGETHERRNVFRTFILGRSHEREGETTWYLCFSLRGSCVPPPVWWLGGQPCLARGVAEHLGAATLRWQCYKEGEKRDVRRLRTSGVRARTCHADTWESDGS